MERLLAVAAAIAGVALVLAAARLNAQPKASFDCHSYASFAGRMAEFREVGAPLAGLLEYLRQNNPPGLALGALEREAKRVYAEGRPRSEAVWSAYKRCQEQLGDLGVEG